MGCTFRLQTFCFCCSLRTGTLIIAILGLAFTMVNIFYVPLLFGKVIYNVNSIIGRIVACLLFLLIHGLLTAGVYKKNERLMLPWIIFVFIESVLMLLCFLILLVPLFAVNKDVERYILMLGCIAVYDALCWYSWLCVWSHYKELSDPMPMSSSSVKYMPSNDSLPEYRKHEDSPA